MNEVRTSREIMMESDLACITNCNFPPADKLSVTSCDGLFGALELRVRFGGEGRPNAHIMGRILDKRISSGFAFHWTSLMEEIVELGYFAIAGE